MRHFLLFILFIICTTQCTTPEKQVQINNLAALAKTYGYLRFFHPSDEAAQADWNKILIKSINDVLPSSKRGLKHTLESTFKPIAPTFSIIHENETYEPLPKVEQTGNMVTISWYHRVAPKLTEDEKGGMSRRIGRNWLSERDIASAYQMMNFPIQTNEDYELELKMKVESEDSLYIGQAMIQVNEQKHEIELQPSDWKTINFKGTISKSSEQTFVIIRLFPSLKCKVLIDDIKLAVAKKGGEVLRVPIYNDAFTSVKDSLPVHWELTNNRHGKFSSVNNGNDTFLQFEKTELPTWQKHPQYGEIINEPIGQGLNCIIPLALWGNSNYTETPKNNALLNRYLQSLEKINLENIPDNSLQERLANVILVWNIVQHFHPNKMDKTQWEEQLNLSLNEAFDFNLDQRQLLQKMLLPLGNTGNWITYQDVEYSFIPASTRLIDNQFTVVQSDVEALKIGDIILGKDGKNQEELYQDLLPFYKNIPHSRRWFAKRIESAKNADPKQKTTLKIKRGSKTMEVKVPIHSPERLSIAANKPSIKSLEQGIEYINMANVSLGEFRYNLHKYKKAAGLIIDLRGASTLNVKDIFPYFSKDSIPYMTYEYAVNFYPNTAKTIWEKAGRQDRESKEYAYINTPKVFLIDENTAYQFESIADWFKEHKLGLFVGDDSFGVAYDAKQSPLFGNYEYRWNPYKITYRNGLQERDVIQPDFYVRPTLEDILENKDVVLDKAVELLSDKAAISQRQ